MEHETKISTVKDRLTTEHLINILEGALQNIDSEYFKLETTYKPAGIVRERVFCYELYHQLRILMGDDKTISLNGEIDKRGHKDFKKKDQKNPDFVFHIPGTHRGNTLVIEVKGKLNKKDIVNDFKTLHTFVVKYSYRAGIFILYNHSLRELSMSMLSEILKIKNIEQTYKWIYLITIEKPGGNCDSSTLSELQSTFPHQLSFEGLAANSDKCLS